MTDNENMSPDLCRDAGGPSVESAVAIVGLACRLPGAPDPDTFWRNLCDGVESIRFFSEEELERAGVPRPLLDDPGYVRASGCLDDIESFDAQFFGINAREAEIMDPQHRLFLECAWEALENAGCDSERYDGRIGVFGGVGVNGYAMSNLLGRGGLTGHVGPLQASIRNRTDHLTTHVCYKLDLRGPGVTVQTACSTSLVAVHLACQSLLNGECDVALAGGASLAVPHHTGYRFQEGGILSPDGHCRAFDAGAAGTVPGSGAGIVVLKRLETALADGDSIVALILGSAINNDGAHKVGYTAPGLDGQVEVVAEALGVANVDPDTIGYVEAHGTGTHLGDPIEVEALTKVFGSGADGESRCALASVKTNIGHLDTAAGVAGLIKAALALKHRKIPPSLHYREPHPEIRFDAGRFYVPDRLSDWPLSDTPPRAGVSSFGIGGTNAHVVLEAAPEPAARPAAREWQLLTLSARSPGALEEATRNQAEYLKHRPDVELADVAHTLQTGRRAFEYRRAIVCRDRDAARILETLDPAHVYTATTEPKPRPITFMFPGQGAQHADMARELYDTEAVFRDELDRCCELLRPELGVDLRDSLYPPPEAADDGAERLQQTRLTQPALFAVEYALARLWIEWGIRPESMIGHSIGEYVAACLAGVLSPADALRLVAVRGRLMQGLPPGAMTVVPMAEIELAPLLGGELSIAAVNGPAVCVAAGPFDAVEELEQRLTERDVVCRRLRTSHAFHSPMMEPMLDAFRRELADVRLEPPRIPYLSNVTGTWIDAAQATDPEYWIAHARGTVRFDDGIRALVETPDRVFLEVGPGRGLMTIARWHPDRAPGQIALTSLPHLHAGRPVASDGEWITTTVGRLWLSGAEVDWQKLHAGESRRRIPLPTYPFQRHRFWIDAAPPSGATREASLDNRPDIADWFYAPSWKRSGWSVAGDGGEPDGARGRTWLVLTGGDPLHEHIVRRLTDRGIDVVTVEPGESFERSTRSAFTVRAGEADDYAALLEASTTADRVPERIVHLWNANGGESRDLGAGFRSLSALGRALGTSGARFPVHVDVVTSNMQEVVGGELEWPEKATVLGPCRAIPREYDGVTCRSIDIDLRGGAAARNRDAVQARAGEHIVRELLAWPAQRDPVVALRGDHRWLQTYEPVRIAPPQGAAPRLRPRGVYLITGGLGGIGLEIAAWLARTVDARLALIGRNALPPRDEWDDWLASHPADDPESKRIESMRAIVRSGGSVLTFACDVADEAALRETVARIEHELGPLNGIVHAAGVGGGALLQLQTPAGSAEVLAPKVAGTRAIESVIRGKKLDFLVLCSSRAAILGGFGQSDYCAANAFLDAFAHYHNAFSPTPTLAIDWSGWREVGMRVDTLSKLGLLDADTSAAQAIGHPLLQRRIEKSAEREVFASDLDVASQWVLDDHRIARQSVVPGTAYLEMVRAAMAVRHGQATIELRDVYFLNLLPVREDESREVRVVLEGPVEGPAREVEFRIVSRDLIEGREVWQQHVMGRAAVLSEDDAADAARPGNIDELIARCDLEERVIAADDPIVTYEDLGPRWLSMKKVHLGRDELVALLELPPQFAGDVDTYALHPALLDRANFTAKVFLAFEGLHLPMGYKAIRIRQPLTPKIYVHARYKPNGDPQLETITFDVTLMDEHGNVLVDIDEFSQKRVRDAGETLKTAAVRGRPVAAKAARPASARLDDAPVAGTLSPAEGVEAFRRALAMPGVSQIVVSPNDLLAAIEHADRLRQEVVEQAADEPLAAGAAHARPELPNDYVAPRTPAETALVEIWERTLGIEPVGIDDNFFELGGDSVVGLQLVAQAKKKGLELSPQQLFGNQTIRELAAALAGGEPDAPDAAASPAARAVPLTPTQLRLLEQAAGAPDDLIGTVTLDLLRPLDPTVLKRAVEHLPRRHDALRLRIARTESGWNQRCVSDAAPSPFVHVDLSALPEGRLAEVLDGLRRQAVGGVDVDAGPVLRALYVERGPAHAAQLVLAAHDLLVDGESWSILLSELDALANRLADGRPLQLHEDAASFGDWAESVAEYAASDQLLRDVSWWTDAVGGHGRAAAANAGNGGGAGSGDTNGSATAPGDGNRSAASARDGNGGPAVVTLSAADTAALLEAGPRQYRMTGEELLTAALAAALADCAGASPGEAIVVELRGHGRAMPAHRHDAVRVVGPLATTFPVALTATPAAGPAALLKTVKEQLRAVPRDGIGYDAARYLRSDHAAEAVAALPAAVASLAFTSRLDAAPAGWENFSPAAPVPRPDPGPSAPGTAYDVRAEVRQGTLRVQWRPGGVVATVFRQWLETLARHCRSVDTVGYTPSDFPMAKINQDQLDNIAARLVGQRGS